MHTLGHSYQPTTSAPISNVHCSEKNFWSSFLEDINSCTVSLVIASPFLTNDATWKMVKELKDLQKKKVKVTVYSRLPEEHSNKYGFNLARNRLENCGVDLKFISKLPHKIAIIDDTICWQGTMNILGFHDSRDHMRRIDVGSAQAILKELRLQQE